MGNEYLNFSEISHAIQFKDVLNWLNISYSSNGKILKGDNFVVTVDKNLFINPKNENEKGSIINFVSHHKQIHLREAAKVLKHQFLSNNSKEKSQNTDNTKSENELNSSTQAKGEILNNELYFQNQKKASAEQSKEQTKIPELTLEYNNILKGFGFDEEFCNKYEFGYCRQKSIMAGKIAFKVRDINNNPTGYVGVSPKDGKWYFPKKFNLSIYNIHRCLESKSIILVVNPLDCLKIISLGWLHTIAILTNSMTKEQEEELKRFKQVLLIHKQPDNIVQRLSENLFVKKIIPKKEISTMTKEELWRQFRSKLQSSVKS